MGLMVAQVAHSANLLDQCEQAIGDARLIAAAPDLLEVLQDIIECRYALLNNRELPMTTEQWEAKCFAAIAKATGETV
jgi:hypothetical protein